MTGFLVKHFIKDKSNRTAYGVLAGIVGIFCNVLLFAGKLTIGLIINSSAVMTDSFNNLSDAASSVISLVGAKLAAKPADKEHPFGHGRYEYIVALIVSFLILEVGFSCFKTSIEKIFHPEELNISTIAIVILVVSVLVKIWLSLFNRKLGKKIDSKVLLATAKDAMGDVFVTSATIVSLLIYRFLGWNVDGYVGCIVALLVFWAGISVAKDTIEPLLGEAVPEELYKEICEKVSSYEGIEGTHDLIVHSYGPARRMASVHAEIKNTLSMEAAHEIVDKIEQDILKEMNIFLVIHMDPIDTDNETVNRCRVLVAQKVREKDMTATIHDFRMVSGQDQINLIFDLVLPYSYKKEGIRNFTDDLESELKKEDHRYNCVITVEHSFVN
ncbi:MAG: cation diffusion facilitator family transporter [Lachnospiraceae bacterium]|nr:cation diffusion facilitator family transporter [Lachnospiraceae bacterium]